MSDKARRVALRELCDHKAGKYLSKDQYSDGGPFPVFGSNSVMGSHTRFLFEGPVSVLARIGSNCGAVMYSAGPCWVNNNASALVARDGVDARWLHALVSTMPMDNFRAGSGQPFIRVEDLLNAPVIAPPLHQQRGIAGVLGAFDDLIETNQRLMHHLDEAFLTSWLKISRESPEMTTIGEHALAAKGLSYKGAFLADTGLPMINLGSFGVDGLYKPSGIKFYDEGEVKERHRLRRGDLVVANTDLTQVRDILGRAVLVPFDQATSTHHTFQVQVPAGKAVRNWIFAALRQDSVRQRLISYATGTTVAALPADALLTQEIPWAPTSVIEQWFESAKHYLIARDGLSEEAHDLVRTRDELLPLLLSGRVSVREVAA